MLFLPGLQLDQWRREENEQAKTQLPNDGHILIAARMLTWSSVEETRAKLLKDGLTEEQVFFCIKAAEILNKE